MILMMKSSTMITAMVAAVAMVAAKAAATAEVDVAKSKISMVAAAARKENTVMGSAGTALVAAAGNVEAATTAMEPLGVADV